MIYDRFCLQFGDFRYMRRRFLKRDTSLTFGMFVTSYPASCTLNHLFNPLLRHNLAIPFLSYFIVLDQFDS